MCDGVEVEKTLGKTIKKTISVKENIVKSEVFETLFDEILLSMQKATRSLWILTTGF